MTVGTAVLNILVFPGFLFLVALGLAGEFVDRKLYARLQNRVGPPWFQPAADFLKLLGKEDVIPEEADRTIFRLAPIFALAATVAAFLYIPLWNAKAVSSVRRRPDRRPLPAPDSDRDLLPRRLDVPLGVRHARRDPRDHAGVRVRDPAFRRPARPSAPCELVVDLRNRRVLPAHPWLWPVNLIGLGVALVALLGKLERVPFDIPEAETEIVAGSFTEYSGRRLAFFRLAV